ncbi:hypothetical protein [Bacteroides xylanisolvens]|uniref:hypothetical protein n=1 Tax=Bacteroides xylanisolvens TaxID=371601 RepID=UPI001F592F0D|nr:hypothetical protein [Bacteroides xylanisolvens]
MKNYIKRLLHTIAFVVHTLLGRRIMGRYPYKKRYSGKMMILANGPSLKNVLFEIGLKKNSENIDFTVMNFFAFDPSFLKIKPRFYCFADPIFVRKSHRNEEVKRLFCYLQENVDWEMNLYIPKWFGIKQFLCYSSLVNPHIHIVSINDTTYEGFECWRNWMYKKNLALPPICTVAQLGLYMAINNGFDEIELYGVEHNMICSLFVNDKNQLCNKEEHFYEQKAVLKPIMRNDNGRLFKISDYLMGAGKLFHSHEQLAEYAKMLHVRIVNCTVDSMIDCYERMTNE